MDRTERPGQYRKPGKAVDHKACRVIEQAFPLQQGGDPLGQVNMLEHGLGRHGVGRGHDRPQHKAPRPWQGGNEPVRDSTDGKGGEGNPPHRKLQYPPQMRTKRMPYGKIGPRQQKWRQEHDQHQIRVDANHGHAGHKGNPDAPQHKGGGRGQAEPARGQFQPHDQDNQQQDELKAPYIGHADPTRHTARHARPACRNQRITGGYGGTKAGGPSPVIGKAARGLPPAAMLHHPGIIHATILPYGSIWRIFITDT